MNNLDFLLTVKSWGNLKAVYLALLVISVLLVVIALFGIFLQQSRATTVTVPSDEKYSALLNVNNPVSEDKAHIFVDIGGAVVHPGVYKLKTGSRMADLLELSGVSAETAAAPWFFKNINTAKVLFDEQKIYIPFEWEVYETTQSIADLSDFPIITDGSGITSTSEAQNVVLNDVSSSTNTQGAKLPGASGSTVNITPSTESSSKVNVNTASLEELETLPGVGPAYAAKIIQARPYSSLQDLKEKAKLSDSLISKIKDEIIF
jgi:competence protein ComEA